MLVLLRIISVLPPCSVFSIDAALTVCLLLVSLQLLAALKALKLSFLLVHAYCMALLLTSSALYPLAFIRTLPQLLLLLLIRSCLLPLASSSVCSLANGLTAMLCRLTAIVLTPW